MESVKIYKSPEEIIRYDIEYKHIDGTTEHVVAHARVDMKTNVVLDVKLEFPTYKKTLDIIELRLLKKLVEQLEKDGYKI